eukprot:TRINITY_DN15433_c0_g1_i1.p1 TRINITY_DN15433_c0_g1~~TRINITY_DN15433_c0_g1_i1.p1  ORF type:complete len:216 (+),score=23.63 TRINITY_DN15433_c0_g1_i1:225-872(+)
MGQSLVCQCQLGPDPVEDVLLPASVLAAHVFPYLPPEALLCGAGRACKGWRLLVQSAMRLWTHSAFIQALPQMGREDMILTWCGKGAQYLLWSPHGERDGCRADLMFRPLALKSASTENTVARLAYWFSASPCLRRNAVLNAWLAVLNADAGPADLELWVVQSHWTDSQLVVTDRLAELRVGGRVIGSLRLYQMQMTQRHTLRSPQPPAAVPSRG